MKRLKLIIIVSFICLSLFNVGCATSYNEDYSIDAKPYFNIEVPKDSKIFFQLPWYRVSAVDYTKNGKLKDNYIVGDNVKLRGQNVDQLNGAKIYIVQSNLKDNISDNYYKSLLLEEDYMFDTGNYKVVNDEFVYPNQDEINEAKRIMGPYVATAKILSFNLVFYDIITEPVRVDSMSIDSLGYNFNFDTFNINPTHLPADQSEEINDIITEFNAGGLLAGPSLTTDGYYFIQGTANTEIKEITNKSLNSTCEVVNEENVSDYEDFEKQNGILFIDQKTTDLEKGDEINLEFNYMYEGIDTKEFRKYDSAVASIANIITLDDGTQYYNYIYQPSLRSAEYNLVHLLHNIR